MLDLYKLHQFYILGSIGSYGRASVHLNISQPSLTRNIQYLERQYGVLLLERSRGQSKVVLTGAGRELHLRAGQILRAAEFAEARLQYAGSPRDVLSFGLGPVIASIALPELSLNTLFSSTAHRTSIVVNSVQALMDGLMEGALEFYIGYVPIASPPARRVRQDFFASWPPIKLWVRPGHPLLVDRELQPRDVISYPRLSTTSWLDVVASIQDNDTREMLDPTVRIDDHAVLVGHTLKSTAVLISPVNNERLGLIELPVSFDIHQITGEFHVISTLGIDLSARATAAVKAMRDIFDSFSRPG
ncbi:MAG: LysR family transcriptional regulator [Hyphomicrobiales bacterium]|nr:MAG: LysR family transcriptional regulator [Hyphomicrobiales bacterium]